MHDAPREVLRYGVTAADLEWAYYVDNHLTTVNVSAVRKKTQPLRGACLGRYFQRRGSHQVSHVLIAPR